MPRTNVYCLAYISVHGGWAIWGGWGGCSQTCGIGIMKQNRKCTNPIPGPSGNPCYGDNKDEKLCLLKNALKLVCTYFIQ